MPPKARADTVTLWRALALSCHPAPTVAVTAIVTLLTIGAGNSAGGTVLVALALLTQQLSIGWSNDWIDAERDRRVHRDDKPAARGQIQPRIVRNAAIAAAVAAVPLSFALGWQAALANLAGLASGWAYNLGVKSTAFSWVPYVVAFGLMPAIATYALPEPTPPPIWALGAGALLGVGAHLANVLPDFETDRATGIRGFPHRIGRRATSLLAPVLLLAATALVTLGPPGAPPLWAWIGFAAAAVLAVAAAVVASLHTTSRRPFLFSIGVAVVDVVLLVATGSALS